MFIISGIKNTKKSQKADRRVGGRGVVNTYGQPDHKISVFLRLAFNTKDIKHRSLPISQGCLSQLHLACFDQTSFLSTAVIFIHLPQIKHRCSDLLWVQFVHGTLFQSWANWNAFDDNILPKSSCGDLPVWDVLAGPWTQVLSPEASAHHLQPWHSPAWWISDM